MKERKIVTVLMGCFLLLIGCAPNCHAEEKSPTLIVQSFFHYERYDDDEFAFLLFKPANQIHELLENQGFSLIYSGVEYNEDYYDIFAFKIFKKKGIEVKVDVSPVEQNIVYFIEMKFDSPHVRQKFLDDSEREGLTKGENAYFLNGYCESGIVVRLLDNNMLCIEDFLI